MKEVLIGHRGEPESWPENSLAGYRAVLQAGARYIETDVQVSADGVAVLSHDPSLLRITGHNLQISETDYRTLRACPAGQPERFGDRYNHLHITRLDEFAALLRQWPQARAFVELKHASIKAFGIPRVFDIIVDCLGEVLGQCTLISFEYPVLLHVRQHCQLPVGWVLPEWSAENRARATALAPEYLFCNRKRLPPGTEPLWQGPWRWVIYTVNDAAAVAQFQARGADMLETNAISRLLDGPDLSRDVR